MPLEIWIFWSCVFLVGYTYILYPVAIWLLARLRPSAQAERQSAPASVSFVIAARNEGARISERVAELLQQIDSAGVEGEVILVLDGPGNRESAEKLGEDHRVRVLELPENRGKAAAISEGAKSAHSEILAFADVRQHWQKDALQRLLESFCDSQTGAVSGDLVLETDEGVLQGVGLYWTYEKWLRRNEAIFDSVVGVTGAICAVRRELFHGVPAGTILDDVYWPMQVVFQGYRVAHNPQALALDRLPAEPQAEFRRKIRTLSGNFQLVTLLPSLLIPWRNRIWWQFLSHKMMRLAVPWLLLVAIVASAIANGPFYSLLFWMQLFLYSTIVLGITTRTAGQNRLTAAAASFAILNLAAWVAFWVWVSGNASRSWTATEYDPSAGARM